MSDSSDSSGLFSSLAGWIKSHVSATISITVIVGSTAYLVARKILRVQRRKSKAEKWVKPPSEAEPFGMSDIKIKRLKVNDGVLEKDDLLHLLYAIKKCSVATLYKLKRNCRNERRLHFNNHWLYSKIVMEYNVKQKDVFEKTTQEVFELAGITEEMFNNTIQKFFYDTDISLAVDSLAATEVGQAPKGITRNVMLEIFKLQLERCEEALQHLTYEYEDYVVIHARIADEIYQKYGLEEEHIAAAYEALNCDNDFEIKMYVDRCQNLISEMIPEADQSNRVNEIEELANFCGENAAWVKNESKIVPVHIVRPLGFSCFFGPQE